MADQRSFQLALVASLPLLFVGTYFKHSTTELAVAVGSVILSTALAARLLSSSADPPQSNTVATTSQGPPKKVTERKKEKHSYDYDVIVIGGGSGGLACAKECGSLGAKTAVCDFVTPSPVGTTWGLGGTCVNVGCIPKKLMHQAALLGEGWKHQAGHFGWDTSHTKGSGSGSGHSWEKLVQNVQQHITNLNDAYDGQLKSKEVTYFNAFASFKDEHTVALKEADGTTRTTTANKFVIAVGGRPSYPDIPGAKEFGITSDDIFSLKAHPGQHVVVVGASYVALECAGFLRGIGCQVTVIVRSILLRGFDQDMANRIGDHLEETGVNMLRGFTPVEISSNSSGVNTRSKAKLTVRVKPSKGEGKEKELKCDTVLFAIGRYAVTDALNLGAAGVAVNKKLKIPVREEKSNVSHIYAIGDCAAPVELRGNAPELTPLAIQVGKLLARRMFDLKTSPSSHSMDWRFVATTVFTPLEYGTIGMSEEDAKEQYGEEDINVYRKSFVPLEYSLLPQHLRPDEKDGSKKIESYHCKLICAPPNDTVVGFHYCGPNAGEVTQGFALAMRLGVKKKDFDDTVGIHPTCAETLTLMPKEAGEEEDDGGCTT